MGWTYIYIILYVDNLSYNYQKFQHNDDLELQVAMYNGIMRWYVMLAIESDV